MKKENIRRIRECFFLYIVDCRWEIVNGNIRDLSYERKIIEECI